MAARKGTSADALRPQIMTAILRAPEDQTEITVWPGGPGCVGLTVTPCDDRAYAWDENRAIGVSCADGDLAKAAGRALTFVLTGQQAA